MVDSPRLIVLFAILSGFCFLIVTDDYYAHSLRSTFIHSNVDARTYSTPPEVVNNGLDDAYRGFAFVNRGSPARFKSASTSQPKTFDREDFYKLCISCTMVCALAILVFIMELVIGYLH